MNHLEFAESESAALEPTSFEVWADRAEAIAGHNLDGDEWDGDRYSLDSAVEAWESGKTPQQYVDYFRSDAYVNPTTGKTKCVPSGPDGGNSYWPL